MQWDQQGSGGVDIHFGQQGHHGVFLVEAHEAFDHITHSGGIGPGGCYGKLGGLLPAHGV